MEETKLILLHRESKNEPIWINVAQIEHLEKLSEQGGTVITMMTPTQHRVVETPKEIQAKIAE